MHFKIGEALATIQQFFWQEYFLFFDSWKKKKQVGSGTSWIWEYYRAQNVLSGKHQHDNEVVVSRVLHTFISSGISATYCIDAYIFTHVDTVDMSLLNVQS